ncbi:DNA-directed RNA polymerase III subunit Rpc5 [Cunninghamella echinulata]|nr:DNA-directed RNA polymerase III subunit Rpc5 [Cunninghamella echinulata]
MTNTTLTRDPIETMEVDHDSDDEIVAEFPVYLSTQLCNNIQIFQYPMRNAPFRPRQGPVGARVKPKAKMVQLDLPLDTRSRYYNTERGEEFSMGTHDKVIKTAYDKRMEEHEEEERYGMKNKKKEDELLDKLTLTSTHVPTQTNYLVGVLHNDELHVTPVKNIIQMRPGFNYLDKIDDKWKAANKRIQEVEKQEEQKKVETEKAQTLQVSMKHNDNSESSTRRNLYSLAVHNAEDENWVPIVYCDQMSSEAEEQYEKLYCKQYEQLSSKMSQLDFLDQISAIK